MDLDTKHCLQKDLYHHELKIQMFEPSLLGTRTARNRPEITHEVCGQHTRVIHHTHSHAHNAPLLEAAGGSEMFCTAGSLGGMVSRHASIKPTSDGKKKK